MTNPKYYQKTFPSDLRVITVPMKNTKAVTVLVLVRTGSKYEQKEINGISHFLEHMFFKGTDKRPNTLKISETLDRVGGTYNAFTGKEMTGFWAKVESRHFDLALDWISDLFLNSKLRKKDIEKEKRVIIEEINMYQDTPMSFIRELWEKLLYGDQPAGRLTLGTKENISNFNRDKIVNYYKSHYGASNVLVCVAGDIKKQETENKIKNHFSNIIKNKIQEKPSVKEKQGGTAVYLHHKKTDQTHLCLGVRGFNLLSEERYPQALLATILGGNMSSRIFISVRVKKGLAYYIRTSSSANTDTGYLVTQAGVDHSNIDKAVKGILKEYKNLKNNKIQKEELKKAKDYLKGKMVLSLESSDTQASFYATQEVIEGKILTPEQKFKKIDEISVNDIKEVADKIFRPNKLNLALIGPFKDESKFKKLLKI